MQNHFIKYSIQHICLLAKNNVNFNANFFSAPPFDKNNQICTGLIVGKALAIAIRTIAIAIAIAAKKAIEYCNMQ